MSSDGAAPYGISYDTTRVANGTHPFAVKAYATDGTTATATASVNVANAARALSVTQNLSNGQTVIGSISWAASTFDREVSKVEFSVDGQLVASDGAAPYGISYDTTRVAQRDAPIRRQGVRDGRHHGHCDRQRERRELDDAQPPSPRSRSRRTCRHGQQLSGTHQWVAVPAGKPVARVLFWIDGKQVGIDNRHVPVRRRTSTLGGTRTGATTSRSPRSRGTAPKSRPLRP